MRSSRPNAKRRGAGAPHEAVPQLCGDVGKGRIGRRDFLRTVALLGVGVPAAEAFLASIGGEPRPLTLPRAFAQEAQRSGGVLRFASDVMAVADPAAGGPAEALGMLRNSLEHLV